MLSTIIAQTSSWQSPYVDYHALAPEIVLGGVICLLLIVEMMLPERQKWTTSTIAGFGLLGTLIPLLSLALDDGPARVMFGGGYVVDDFSLVLKALFCIAAYVVILMSTTYVDEGDYYQGEYYFLVLTSVLGMLMISSSRDLISMFVAFEFLSIPSYMLAAWRKRDLKSNEAGIKYFLLGVFASAIMLYGMSLLYGEAGTMTFSGIASYVTAEGNTPILAVGILFIIIGFAFKVSAVPFHSWAPDTYEGAPTPVTAFLSVASKAAGFVALLTLVFAAFPDAKDTWQPVFWILAALTMTLGNLMALKQTNIVRMLAYSSIAQGGFIIMPLAVVGRSPESTHDALVAVVTYLIVYAAMNLGAFSVILAVSRKTGSGEITSFGGLFGYAPGLTVAMTIFLVSLGGIPPTGGFIAKLYVFKSLTGSNNGWAIALALIGVVNSVIALYYYLNVAKNMWFMPAPDGDTTPIRTPASLISALTICTVATLAIGIVPQIVLRFGDIAQFASP